jgi:hypothetical protein
MLKMLTGMPSTRHAIHRFAVRLHPAGDDALGIQLQHNRTHLRSDLNHGRRRRTAQLPLMQILLAEKSGLAGIDRSLPFRQIIEFEATLPVGQHRLGAVEGAFDQNPADRFAGGGIDHGATQAVAVGLRTIRSRLGTRTDLPLKRRQSEPRPGEQPGERCRRSGGRKSWSVGKSGHGSDTTDPEGTYSLLDSKPGEFVA